MIPSLPALVRREIFASSHNWLPGITHLLVASTWDEAATSDFTPDNYGTHRWLQRNPDCKKTEFACIDLEGQYQCVIEHLPVSSQKRYSSRGIEFSDLCPTNTIDIALQLILAVPTLQQTIALLLRCIHILKAPTESHDVSHSDPEVPFSIFVSVPPMEPVGRLRLAESIVHECMHLQLTMIEKTLPLVSNPHTRFFSPWQQTLRPASGLLHGLYVFATVHEFLEAATRNSKATNTERQFALSRRHSIKDDIEAVRLFSWHESLTADGQMLVQRLYQSVLGDVDR